MYFRKTERLQERKAAFTITFQLTARDLLYAPSRRYISTYMGFVTPVVEHWLQREIA